MTFSLEILTSCRQLICEGLTLVPSLCPSAHSSLIFLAVVKFLRVLFVHLGRCHLEYIVFIRPQGGQFCGTHSRCPRVLVQPGDWGLPKEEGLSVSVFTHVCCANSS